MDFLDPYRELVLAELRRLNAEEKLSGERLAEMTTLSGTYIHYLIRGKRGERLSLEQLIKIWQGIGKDANELFADNPFLQRIAMLNDKEVQSVISDLIDELQETPPDHREWVLKIFRSTLGHIKTTRKSAPNFSSEK